MTNLESPQPTPGYNTAIPAEIMTANEVETSIGTLKFFDGAPLPETVQKVYNYLDTMRAADTFMKGMPGASLKALIDGAHSLGAVAANEVMIFDKLMDAKSFFLTANSSTIYAIPDLDLKRDGPTVVEVPDGLLGAANDAWFRFINNLPTGGKSLSPLDTMALYLMAMQSTVRKHIGSGYFCDPLSRMGRSTRPLHWRRTM